MLKHKFKLLLFLEAIVACVLLLLCFLPEKKIYTVLGQEIEDRIVEGNEYRKYSGEEIELNPGVYQVRIRTHLEEGQTFSAEIRHNGAYFKALRNNGVTIMPAENESQFNVYVVDKVSTAYVYCRFAGADANALLGLEIYRTSIGTRMLLFMILCFYMVLDFFIVFRRRILSGSVTGKQQVVFWTLSAGVLIAFFPYLTDYISFTGDLDYHISRIAFLKDALQMETAFPVKMQGTWLYGHGYATSVFYGDLFLYFPACLMWLGFSIMTAYKMFVFAVLAASAWIGYHCLYRCVREEYAALFGSMMYVLAPYGIFNVYNRGAVGEYLAMTFLPLICCGMYLLYSQDTKSPEYGKYKWYLIWGMSALLQSHIITTEMVTMMMALVCIVFWRKTFRKKTFLQLLETVGIVLMVNLFFWLPLLYMMRIDKYQFQTWIQQEMVNGTVLAGALQLLPNKGGAQTGMWNCEPIQLGAGAIFLLLAFLLWKIRGRKAGKACQVFAIMTGLTLVLSTKYVPWNMLMKLPVIGFFVGAMQFPFRWMALASAFVAMFSAFFLRDLRKEECMQTKMSISIAAMLVFLSAIYHVNDCAFEARPIFLYNAENMGTVGIVNGEWLLSDTDKTEFKYHDPVAQEGLVWRDYEKKGTSVAIFLENTSSEARYLELPLMGYKGYAIEEMSGGVHPPVIAEERGAHNDLRIEVPGGYQGEVHVFYQGFLVFHIAEAVSFITILVILGGKALQKRKVQHERKRA